MQNFVFCWSKSMILTVSSATKTKHSNLRFDASKIYEFLTVFVGSQKSKLTKIGDFCAPKILWIFERFLMILQGF